MGRELRIAVAPGATGFDPEQGGSNGDFQRLCYARLFTYRTKALPGGELVSDQPNVEPVLAERYEVSPDGKVYTVYLRKGVVSPAGNELTADDVKWSWERALEMRDVGKWVALVGSLNSPDNVKVLDRYVVKFTLSASNPTFLQQLTRATPAIHDATEVRRHTTEQDPWAKEWLRKSPAGFGSYQLESLTPWKEIVFVANPGAAGGAPPIERIRFVLTPGKRRRQEMLKNGEVDLLTSIDVADVAALSGAPGVHISQAPSGAHIALIMHTQIPPFDRREVRQAVAYAVESDRIRDEVFHGMARPWHSPIPSTTPFSTDKFWRYDYSPGEAKRLLAEAGLPEGFETEIFVDAADEPHIVIARIIADSLAKVGIHVEVETLDSATFWQGGRYFQPYPLVIWDGMDQVPDPLYALIHDYGPGKMGLTNAGRYANPELFALIRRIEHAADPEERRSLVEEAQRLVMDDSPVVFIAQPDFLAAMRTDLDGFAWPADRFLQAERLSFRS